jgi:hypothetical protein
MEVRVTCAAPAEQVRLLQGPEGTAFVEEALRQAAATETAVYIRQ